MTGAERVDQASDLAMKLRGRPIRFAGHLGLRNPQAPLFAHTARSTSPRDQIDRLADLGFVGVQDIALKLRPADEQMLIGRKLAARGLRFASFGSDPLHWNQPLWSRTDAEAHMMLRQSIDDSIAAANRVGGGDAICVAGLDPARSRTDQIGGMVDNLKRFGERAARGGVRLLVEAVAEAWIPDLLMDSLAEAAAVVRAVDDPSVRLMFDVGHVWLSGEGADMKGALAAHWDVIGGIQVADMPGRVDLGSGSIDWRDLFNWVDAQGYDGLVEVEHEPADATAAGERRLIERLCTIDVSLGGGQTS